MDIHLRNRLPVSRDVTPCLQSAIDEAARNGGGTVTLPAGEHVCGPLILKSRIRLLFEDGARILGRWEGADLSARALIGAEKAEDIALAGKGLIDARGTEQAFPRGTKNRPHGIAIRECRNVTIEDVGFRNSPSWGVVFDRCDGVKIVRVVIDDHNNYNNDGIDIADCRNVRILACDVSSDDDGICLKSFTSRGNDDVEIAHCRIASHCNALKTGTESYGAFRNIRIHDCEIVHTRSERVYFGKPAGQSAICLSNVDGATLDGVLVRDIAIRSGTDIPFCLKLGARLRAYGDAAPRPVGVFRNVVLENIHSRNTLNSPYACLVAGVGSDGVVHRVEDITLRNIALHFVGDVEEVVANVEERAEAYPHPYVLGPLPACGVYCRHVHGLRLEHLTLTRLGVDRRPMIRCVDVEGLEADGEELVRE